MYSEFRTQDLGNDYSVVEPPAGLLPHIKKRTDLYTDADGNSQLTQSIWAAIFVLSCLHKKGVPVACEVAATIGNPLQTIRDVFCNMPDGDFKTVVDEFLFNVSRDQLKEWFDTIDALCYISKKVEDTEKNG